MTLYTNIKELKSLGYEVQYKKGIDGKYGWGWAIPGEEDEHVVGKPCEQDQSNYPLTKNMIDAWRDAARDQLSTLADTHLRIVNAVKVIDKDYDYIKMSQIPAWDEFYKVLAGTYPITRHYTESICPRITYAVVEVDAIAVNTSKAVLFGGVAMTKGRHDIPPGTKVKLELSFPTESSDEAYEWVMTGK